MNSNDNVVVGVLVGAGVIVVLAIGLSQGWAVWWFVPPILALVGGALLVRRRVRFPREQEWLVRDPEPQPEPAEHVVEEIPLETNWADYRFLFSATVRWRLVPGESPSRHAEPAALATEAVLARAAVITREISPADAALAEYRLAAALGTEQLDHGREVLAWATDVTVVVPDGDAKWLRALADLRKSTPVRDYLRTDVLESPGSALGWWLAGNTDEVEKAAQLIKTLALLSAVAQGRAEQSPNYSIHVDGHDGQPTPYRVFGDNPVAVIDREPDPAERLANLLGPLLSDSEDGRTVMFVRGLISLANRCGLGELAEYARELVGLQDLTQVPPNPDEDNTPPSE